MSARRSAPYQCPHRIALAFLIAIILVAAAGKTEAQGADAERASAGVIAFVNENLAAYQAASQLASRKAPPPDVPVPPIVDFPCAACADAVQTGGVAQQDAAPSEGVAQVEKWIEDSLQPEATHIHALLNIERELSLLGCQNGCGDGDMLSPEAVKALKKFGTAAEINEKVTNLADRVWKGKVLPMYKSYGKDPTRAYAGVRLILRVGREMALWGDLSANETAPELTSNWLQEVVNRTEHDAVNGHFYNLCPSYLSILQLMGIMDDKATFQKGFENWSERVATTMQKLDRLMFFDMVVKLHATGRSSDGGNMDITWMGKAKLHLEIQRERVTSDGRRFLSPCYKPEFLDGGRMRVNVVNFTLNGPQGGVQLVSPHSFDAVLANPQLNLCDPHPLFQVALSGMKYPQEVIQASGGPPANTTLLGPFLGMVSVANELNRDDTNAMTGNANHLSPDQRSNDQAAGSKQGMNSAQAEITAHQGDVAWMMSAEGQAAIARLQSEAMGMVQSKLAAQGFDLPRADNMGQLGMSLSSAHLQWTNGQSAPVYQTLKVQKDGADFELTVSVENTPLQ